MNEIINQLLKEQHETLQKAIRAYDPNAGIFLFGPGATKASFPVDVYVYSTVISPSIRDRVFTDLRNKHHLNSITKLYGLNKNRLSVMEKIGVAV